MRVRIELSVLFECLVGFLADADSKTQVIFVISDIRLPSRMLTHCAQRHIVIKVGLSK